MEKSAAKPKVAKRPLAERLEIDWGDGLTAFFFASVLVAAGFALGHVLTLGAHSLLETRAQAGSPAVVPIVGARVELILPLVIGIFGGTRSGYKARHLKKIGVGVPLRVKKGLEDDG